MIAKSKDEGEIPEKKEETHRWAAFCGSTLCISKYYRDRRGTVSAKKTEPMLRRDLGVEKKIKYRTTFCPDCGHAIYWKRVPIKKGRK